MSIVLNVNGVNFNYPERGDNGWGVSATNWASAVTTGMLQKAGGLFLLSAEVDFGQNFGLKSLYLKSRTSNPATAGAIRLAKTDVINWRNNANDANLSLSLNGSDELEFNGQTFSTQTITVADTTTIALSLVADELTASIRSGSIQNSMINAGASIDYSKLNLAGQIVNADIATGAAIAQSKLSLSITNSEVNASAAIAYTKLATLTASRALQSGSGGKIEVSNVTSTELGYLENLEGNVQTLLDEKLDLAGGTMTGPIDMSGELISGVADPVSAQDAATKAYVDSNIQGLKAKQSVKAATTTNGTFSTAFANGQTIDGVSLVTNDRILIKNQSDQTQNGIYVVNASGAPTRSSDANTWDELVSAYVLIQQGTVNADSGWLCTINPGGTLGVNNVTWVQFSQAGVYSADGLGIELTGLVFSLELDGSTLSKSASGLKVANGGITNTQVSASAAIDYSKLAAMTAGSILMGNASNLPTVTAVTGDVTINSSGVTAIASGVIVNADINASAAIALSKLAALTTSRALQSNASTGAIEASSVTNTELGYLSGVTSAIQTQLGTKITNPMSNVGDLIRGGTAGAPTVLPIGSSGHILSVVGGIPTWAANAAAPSVVVPGAYPYTAVSNTIVLVDTSAARSIQLPAPASGFFVTIKDKLGQAATNPITFVRNGSEQIEGVAADKVVQTNWGSWTLTSDGTNWYMI